MLQHQVFAKVKAIIASQLMRRPRAETEHKKETKEGNNEKKKEIMKTVPGRDICSPTFIAELFRISKIRKHPRMDKKMCHFYGLFDEQERLFKSFQYVPFFYIC
jgi:hypothetical protein